MSTGSLGAGTAPMPCKIMPSAFGFQVRAQDTPVTINLCSDSSGTLATEVQFVSVIVSDNATLTSVAGQPVSQTPNSFVLDLAVGKYRIDMVVGPAAGASVSSSATAYAYEACSGASVQICFFDTAVAPTCAFRLEVIS
jgi:hypothetical protein